MTSAAVQPRVWQFELTGPILNANLRLHWRPLAKLKAEWRDMAHQKAIATVGSPRPMLEQAKVTLTLVPARSGVRDAENLAPLAKAVVDGLVRAKVLAGDDIERMPAPTLLITNPVPGQLRGTYTVFVKVEEVLS